MKHRLLFLITLLSCLVAKAEHSYLLKKVLDSGQDHHYTANSHIMLADGFGAAPENGHEVLLDINAYAIYPPESGITGGTPQNNEQGVVGAIGGTVEVNLMGGAIYSIPIELPTGLGGMKPQLSISYNSQSRNGLLGWGWDLAGISSITRVGQTIYHDGNVSAVNFETDRFCLDGKRLLQVSPGEYGGDGTSYRTEMDQMSKIVSYRQLNIKGPAYFRVWTADGNLLYYGNTVDSRALIDGQNHIGVWLLSRVEDRNGNSIEYHYTIGKNDYRLARIAYSGNKNDNINPTFSIEFLYSDREDAELTATGNLICKMNKKLDEIVVRNGKNDLYSYHFDYQKPSPKNGFPYHLLTKIQFQAGKQHFNPTKIQWGNNNYNAISASNLKCQVSSSGIPDAFVNAVKFSGDINGDSYTDVIALKPDNNGHYTTANLFLNRGLDGTQNFDFVRSFSLSPNISWIQMADFNGDGLDDILFSNRIRRNFPFPDQIEAEIYLCKRLSSGGYGFDKQVTPLCFVSHNTMEAHLVGDFLGEGKNSILIQTVLGKGSEESQLFYYDEETGHIELNQFTESLHDTRLFAADYDGDGITEILYKNGDKHTVIVKLKKRNNTFHYEEIFNRGLEDWSDCFPGDFNGDGQADVLLYTPNVTRPWKIHLSKGSEISLDGYHLPDNFPYSSPGNYLFSLDQPHHTSQHLKTGDFDGNGCADLALYSDNMFYVYYGPLKETGDFAPFTNLQRIDNQSFGLYDNMSMTLGNFLGQERLSFLGPTTLSRLPSMRLRHEVKQITDGMGRKTEFVYDYLSPMPNSPSTNDFYRLNGTGLDHFYNTYCIALPMRGLKKTITYNVAGKAVETQCYYEDALLHKYGKGFLGFSKTRQEDYCDKQLQGMTIKQFDIEHTDHVIHTALQQEEIFDPQGHLMAQSVYNNQILSNLDNSKVFIPLADKYVEEYDINHPDRLVKKEIYNTFVDLHCNQPYQYNETISVTGQIKGTTSNPNYSLASNCEFQEITNTTYYTDNYSSWLINRPKTVTHTYHREGNYEDVSQQQVFTYYSNKPHLAKSILELPNDGSLPEDRLAKLTELKYDPTGNITLKTIGTPNDTMSPRRESFEYSKTYGRRLLTKHTDALGQACVYEYDPLYNYRTSVTDCNGLKTQYEQDPLGITCTTHYPDGTLSCIALRWGSDYYYQWEKKSGQKTKISTFAFTGDPIGTRSYNLQGGMTLTQIEYDPCGRIRKKTLPYNISKTPQSIIYQYDSHNRLERIDHEDGSYETLHHEMDRKSTTYYALDGNIQTESKTFNVMGWVIRSTDAEGNSIVYDHRADGKPISAQVEGQDLTRIEMDYDGLGNRIILNDPNYGLTTYEYNAFNEVVKQVSPKLDETIFSYDELGRTIQRVESEKQNGQQETTRWVFGTKEGIRGLPTDIFSPNHLIHYDYDKQLRLEHISEQIEGNEYHTVYSYDSASRIASIRYPSGYAIAYNYTSEGYLKRIDDAEGNMLWKTVDANALLQPTDYITGNGFATHNEYDPQTNRLRSIQTSFKDKDIQFLVYDYDDFANMTYRIDKKNGFEESFNYDKLNRLVQVKDSDGISEFDYDLLGRMIHKTNPEGIVFTEADYSGTRPHALKSVQAPTGVFPQEEMIIEYNTYNKVSSLTEGEKRIQFDYGYDHQRIRTRENLRGETRTKTYVNACEYIEAPEGHRVWTFLSGPMGVFAVAETIDGETALHYIHKDHLGSWTVISDSEGNVEQETRFDAWGGCKEPDKLMFDRGFTGHEHLKGMRLINMNGRLYDPITSSMISPDNNIQMPDFTQNLNRYAYCLNNPLAYTDPDGNTFIESAIMFYLLYCTDLGYEIQKYMSPLALHIDLHLSTQQIGLGFDCSFGIPKHYAVSYRTHIGASYYCRFFDNSYSGFEFRLGGEWCLGSCIGYSGTTFYQKKQQQTTNAIILGNYFCNFTYENDYMFNLGKYIPFIPSADNGDRYRTAAARFRCVFFSVGVNIFTGDPGKDHDIRNVFNDPERDGRETYTISANGDNPDEYRAGYWYAGIGPFKIGWNSEGVRDFLQNRFAHDWLCKKDSPYFKMLDRPRSMYFYFGTETGNTLW